jgi:hypothetical protein
MQAIPVFHEPTIRPLCEEKNTGNITPSKQNKKLFALSLLLFEKSRPTVNYGQRRFPGSPPPIL